MEKKRSELLEQREELDLKLKEGSLLNVEEERRYGFGILETSFQQRNYPVLSLIDPVGSSISSKLPALRSSDLIDPGDQF